MGKLRGILHTVKIVSVPFLAPSRDVTDQTLSSRGNIFPIWSLEFSRIFPFPARINRFDKLKFSLILTLIHFLNVVSFWSNCIKKRNLSNKRGRIYGYFGRCSCRHPGIFPVIFLDYAIRGNIPQPGKYYPCSNRNTFPSSRDKILNLNGTKNLLPA